MATESLAGFLLGTARRLSQPKSLIPVSPETLYHRVWDEVTRRIVDPSWLPCDWNQWRHRFDGRIRTDEQAVQRANEMLASIQDWNTYLTSAEEVRREMTVSGIGMTCAFKRGADRNYIMHRDGGPMPDTDADGHPIITVTEGGPAWKAGMRTGDTIARVDGVETAGCSYRWLSSRVTGRKGTYATILLGKSELGIWTPLFIPRMPLAEAPSVTTDQIDGVGYIKLLNFTSESQEALERVLQELHGVDSIIVDLRENNGGYHSPAIAMTSMFLKEGTIVRTEERIAGDANSPQYVTKTTWLTKDQLLVQTARHDTPPSVTRGRRTPFMVAGKRIFVLINDNSASCAELFAGALKDNGAAILIGIPSAGKGTGQFPLEMPNGTRLEISVDRYFTPSGVWPGDGGNRVSPGIAPNVVVEPRASVFVVGSVADNQLATAYELALQG